VLVLPASLEVLPLAPLWLESVPAEPGGSSNTGVESPHEMTTESTTGAVSKMARSMEPPRSECQIGALIRQLGRDFCAVREKTVGEGARSAQIAP
jgi:hypothetical protein